MAKFYTELTEDLQRFIANQKLFFTATAPANGRINLSPKGIDTFRCVDRHTVAYLDLTGSGNETAAHLKEDGRMTIMFCSFSEKPMILRLYGHGQAIQQHQAQWQQFHSWFESLPGERQIIVLAIEAVQTSCGYGVPLFDFKQERGQLLQWAEKKGKDGITQYWREKNQRSIDGLPTGLLADSEAVIEQ
jgi:hypothetical protein